TQPGNDIQPVVERSTEDGPRAVPIPSAERSSPSQDQRHRDRGSKPKAPAPSRLNPPDVSRLRYAPAQGATASERPSPEPPSPERPSSTIPSAVPAAPTATDPPSEPVIDSPGETQMMEPPAPLPPQDWKGPPPRAVPQPVPLYGR